MAELYLNGETLSSSDKSVPAVRIFLFKNHLRNSFSFAQLIY